MDQAARVSTSVELIVQPQHFFECSVRYFHFDDTFERGLIGPLTVVGGMIPNVTPLRPLTPTTVVICRAYWGEISKKSIYILYIYIFKHMYL